jgi:pyruvate-ferredoxin/flavodoxin oxidoreductase
MAALRNTAIRWYRKVFGAPAGSDIREEGLATVLDGNTAVTLSEAGIATHAVLGGTAPMNACDGVWRGEVAHGTNLFGQALAAQTAEGPRGIVAAATGLALAGRRATAFLSGPDIAASQDLLISAAGKHVPLVLHVGARAAAAHGSAPGTGHETVHLGADSGFCVLFAANVQQAVDFTYVARRVAEETLVPVMVVMDGEQTALAAQDVRLLSPAQVNALLGAPDDRVDAPTEAQRLLFGDSRRRVPAWHDLDEPVLSGALFDSTTFALGALARGPFFDSLVGESLQEAFRVFESKTGRRNETVSQYRLKDATTVLVVQGSAIETACCAADYIRKHHKVKVGVLGIHVLRPFPAAEIQAALNGKQHAYVLERVNATLTEDPPLTREVRASLERSRTGPKNACQAVVYGVGGLPLRVADLVELCTRQDLPAAAPLFLGIAFDDPSAAQPKREVLLDALRRAYPDVAARGVRASSGLPASPVPRSLSIAIRRSDDRRGHTLAEAAAAMLQKLEEGRVRSRPAVAWDGWGEVRTDRLVVGDDELRDPGDDLAADVVLDAIAGTIRIDGEDRAWQLSPAAEADRSEWLLGALFAALLDAGLIEHKPRRVVSARRAMLDGLGAQRRDALANDFESGFGQLDEGAVTAPEPTTAGGAWSGDAPAAVGHLGRNDDVFASLPRFWDQAGVLYASGRADQLTADPFLATGTMPPLSATFNTTSAKRRRIPAFDPAACTGCARCWTNCPDSAIGVVAAGPAALIDAGIRQAGADAVRPVASKLASRIISASKKAEEPAPTFGVLLEDAYTWLKDKMPLDEDRKQAIDEGVAGIVGEVGDLPVAVTQPFFQDAEALKKDGAEFLSIVINPDACKSCGICVQSCEPEALKPVEQDAATLSKAQALWSVFSTAPDTASETIERVAENPEIGRMASLLLSRYCQFAMSGGDPAEAGSGEKIAVKLALGATEFHQQPLVQNFATTLADAGESLAKLIEETLSHTLAVEDLEAVSERLRTTSSPRVDLRELAESVGAAGGDHSVDTDYLLRLIDLSQRINTARENLVSGAHGLGRARYGLAVAGGSTAAWAGAFPHNPFQAPVVIDMTGDAAQIAAGLVEGHLHETTELARLLRLARLELDQPDGIDWKRAALADLHWQDLGEDELELCPPLVLIGSDEMIAGQGLGQLIWLLNAGLPVKMVVLSELDFGLRESWTNDPRAGLGLLALAQRKAYVAQSSIGHPAHLGECMLEALRSRGPALLQIYAPSPSRHGFESRQSPELARLAVTTRTLPLFRYDPDAEGVFGSRISLDGNPAPEIGAPPAEEDGHVPTTADWAFRQERFAMHFAPLAADAPAPTALHEWLQLDEKGRKGKTPFVTSGDGDDAQRIAVAAPVADVTDGCLANWQTLQELAGVVTPFTERVEEEIRAAVAAEHKAELDAQKKAADDEIRAIREQTQTEIAAQIRSRLMALASRKRS